jgi:hypothetical protein
MKKEDKLRISSFPCLRFVHICLWSESQELGGGLNVVKQELNSSETSCD